MTRTKTKKLYYTLKEIGNRYFINDIEVEWSTFKKIFYDMDNYKQVNYTCYFNSSQDFVKEWVLQEV